MVTYNQNGYVGQSMSVGAKQAYDMGEKPLSKWTKADILEGLPSIAASLKKFNLKTLREYCLERTSWHHTGKFANRTDFYSLKDEDDIDPSEIVEIKPEPKKKEDGDGLRYHGHYIEKEYHPYSRWNRVKETRVDFKNATRKGDWLILESGQKKKFANCVIERTTKRKIK